MYMVSADAQHRHQTFVTKSTVCMCHSFDATRRSNTIEAHQRYIGIGVSSVSRPRVFVDIGLLLLLA